MSPDYIEYIHKLYNDNKNKYDDFILNFHPTKLMVKTGEEYTHGRDYSKVCSMFSTLIQKNVKHGIMDIVHDHLSRLTKNVIYIPKGYVKLGIHNNNRISKLKDTLSKKEICKFGIRPSDDFVKTQLVLAMSHGVTLTLCNNDFIPLMDKVLNELFHTELLLRE